ncbi:hypothetical protein, partial [Streptomyces sp. WAC01526]|uniref:hypothetical protein n=1 Tax=Streptomyces sp. WAC01526 TaxID=2588709 RepID=UPI001CA35D37
SYSSRWTVEKRRIVSPVMVLSPASSSYAGTVPPPELKKISRPISSWTASAASYCRVRTATRSMRRFSVPQPEFTLPARRCCAG